MSTAALQRELHRSQCELYYSEVCRQRKFHIVNDVLMSMLTGNAILENPVLLTIILEYFLNSSDTKSVRRKYSMNYNYIFYKLTNKISGMSFIGRTRKPLEEMRHMQGTQNASQSVGAPLLQRAIREHGRENFECEVIKQCECSQSESFKIVNQLIEDYNTITPNGYNINASKGKSGEHANLVNETRYDRPVKITFQRGSIISMEFASIAAAINYFIYTGRLVNTMQSYIQKAVDAAISEKYYLDVKWEFVSK